MVPLRERRAPEAVAMICTPVLAGREAAEVASVPRHDDVRGWRYRRHRPDARRHTAARGQARKTESALFGEPVIGVGVHEGVVPRARGVVDVGLVLEQRDFVVAASHWARVNLRTEVGHEPGFLRESVPRRLRERRIVLDHARLAPDLHALLGVDRKVRHSKNFHRKSPPALLRGLVYAPNGNRMVPSYTVKTSAGGKRYRYYADLQYVRFGKSDETFGSINAEQLEGIVVQQVLQALQSPASIQAVWDAVQAMPQPMDEAEVVLAMRNLGSIWPSLFPEEQSRIVNLLIRRVQFTADAIEIQWHPMGWQALVGEFQPNSIGAELAEME